MKRILFVAEAVSLAHVARPHVLARSLLGDDRFQIHFASAKRYPIVFPDRLVREWPIESIDPDIFRLALEKGRPIYSRDTLTGYVEQDLALLDEVRPDVVVGDFRLSLAVSAPKRGIHYVAITNAHWSPYSSVHRLPLPEHRLGSLFGTRVAKLLFNAVEPVVLAHHAAALNSVRRKYGLAPLGSLREVYTWADTTLYADVPELVPTDAGLPATHRYIGPILWSPDVAKPDWWDSLPDKAVCVYVTLGSTGQLRALPAVLDGLAGLPVTVLLATAGRIPARAFPPNVKSAAFLPGDEAVRRSAFVICNGGSATVYQALSAGKPVLGIASNLDQHLTMDAVVKVGAGMALRAEKVDSALVRDAARRLLAESGPAADARKVERWFARYDARRIFRETVVEISGPAR